MSSDHKETGKFFLLNERRPIWRPTMRIAAIYTVFGFLWIFFSDSIVATVITDPEIRVKISMAKGSLYVLLSALIIYVLISRALSKISDDEQVILENRNELKTLLYYDHLTGLNNRRKLIERLPDYLQDATDKGKGLLYVDIDNTKLINDSMGHSFGDNLIANISRRISSVLSPPDEIYRLDGDEFLVLTKFNRVAEIQKKAQDILNLFVSPVSIEKIEIHCTVSIGISLFPLHSEDPFELLKYSDIARHQSKKNGKQQAVLYNANMMHAINERMSIGESLHDALSRNELEVYFQPQIDTRTRKITSFEALLRWTNPELGRVPPDKFISVAEETHLIIPIGEWILLESCRFINRLNRQGFGNLTVSVNISMIQLLQENFIQIVDKALAETEVDPSRLELEITESILMESYQAIKRNLDMLRIRGIGIALDDFGKGYSSLSYLEQLPITTLKIDKIFIDGIRESGTDNSITGNIVRIGKKLGLIVIAEGVENETQFAYLANQQCDRIQGWIFSKAIGASEAEALTRQNLG